jgi:uncharacterized repeat protein (TIGR03803 family)
MHGRDVALLVISLLSVAMADRVSAQATLTTLHEFDSAGGSHPVGGLTFDTTGALYGATDDGGASNAGTIFKLTPPAGAGPWTKTVLYAFKAGADGAQPVSAPVFDSFGALYGATARGGSGNGVVFRLTPPVAPSSTWTKTILYRFRGGADGKTPSGPLLFDTFGSLYGVTESGGSSAGGTVFKLSSAPKVDALWTNRVIFNFPGSIGTRPRGNLMFDTTGALYGSASGGGECCGTVISIRSPTNSAKEWSETVLHAFSGARSDGSSPDGGLIFDTTGSLYGVTKSGGTKDAGTVFKISPPTRAGGGWTNTVLYNFRNGPSDGASPAGGIVLDTSGAIYGATRDGGISNAGTIFKLTPPDTADGKWTEALVYEFTGGADGAQPAGSLITDGSGALYGMTAKGGANNAGTVFRLMP